MPGLDPILAVLELVRFSDWKSSHINGVVQSARAFYAYRARIAAWMP